MPALPQRVLTAWEQREGPVVLTTVDSAGTPNAIYATSVSKFGDDRFVIADNYFHKTRANIFAGSTGSLLFITTERKSYQVKGRLEYYTEGAIFDDMKRWNSPRLPGHAVVALIIEQVFCGAEQLI